ncbi:MAG: hypothetical protein ACRDG7_13345, partial [Candidatus Limnocylindria bacterium]
MNCATVDELAAAYALDAVEAEEEHAISEHLRSCERRHAEARAMIDAAAAIPAALDRPSEPPHALRDRILHTAAATPQDHRAAPAEREATAAPPR